MEEPGSYNLSLEAFNDISRHHWFGVVQVQYPIVALKLRLHPVILGNPVIVEATVTGGLGLNLSVDYDDGNVVLYTTLDLRTTVEFVGNSEKNVPIHRIKFQHLYNDTGNYRVTVNVSNHVSSMVKSHEVTVEDQIEGLEIGTDSAFNIQPTQVVSITATVNRGNNLKFVWKFSDGHVWEDDR